MRNLKDGFYFAKICGRYHLVQWSNKHSPYFRFCGLDRVKTNHEADRQLAEYLKKDYVQQPDYQLCASTIFINPDEVQDEDLIGPITMSDDLYRVPANITIIGEQNVKT